MGDRLWARKDKKAHSESHKECEYENYWESFSGQTLCVDRRGSNYILVGAGRLLMPRHWKQLNPDDIPCYRIDDDGRII